MSVGNNPNKDNCKCKKDGTGAGIPIGGPWAPFWTGMMIVLGLSFGVYSLMDEEALSGLSLGGTQAAMWTRALIVAGLVIGGTAATGTYGFEAAALCTSTLSIFVPWTVYWVGLFVATGFLIGTYSLISETDQLTV